MSHGIINEQGQLGHWLDVRDDISGKNEYIWMFSCRFLASGA